MGYRFMYLAQMVFTDIMERIEKRHSKSKEEKKNQQNEVSDLSMSCFHLPMSSRCFILQNIESFGPKIFY